MTTRRCPRHENLRFALNAGNNLMSRFWLSLASLLTGAGVFLGAKSWLYAPSYIALADLFPPQVWGALLLSVGSLGLWRVLSPASRPWAAWSVNIYMAFVWTAATVARLHAGPESLASVHTVFALMALWCLTRTEATYRDTRTA